MKYRKKTLNSVAMALPFFVIVALVTGCTTVEQGTNQLKAEAVAPAPDAGFIQNPERQHQDSLLPFQKVWIKPGFDKSGYQELIVPPVNTQYMQELDWMHKLTGPNILGDIKKDTEELAVYFHDQVVTKFKEDPNHRFQVIEYISQHKAPALRLELALVEINPSQAALHALSWAGPPGTGTAAGAINKRTAAFEGRLRDLQTGEVVATFADRDMQDAGPIDLTRLTWYGPAKGIMDRWAEQFVQVANRKPGEKVGDPTPFTLRPF
jgi:hypothetical protein